MFTAERFLVSLLIALSVLDFAESRNVRRLPLRKLIRHGVKSSVPQIAVPAVSAATGTDPITFTIQPVGYPQEIYTLNGTVGTPGKAFRFALASGNFLGGFTPLVFADNTSAPCDGHLQPQRQIYSCNASTSCNGRVLETFNAGISFQTACDELFGINGYVVADNLAIGNTPSSAVDLFVANASAPLNPSWKADGFLTVPSDFSTLLAGTAQPQLVGFYFGSNVAQGQSGTMILGGADAEHCSSDWHWSEQLSIGGCANCFNVIDMRMGKTSIVQDSVQMAQPYLGFPDTSVTESILDAIVSVTKAQYDFATDRYEVQCKDRGHLPDLKLTLNGGYVFELAPNAYARQRVDKPSKCYLTFNTQMYAAEMWIGTAFFTNHCVLYNNVNNTIAFAAVL